MIIINFGRALKFDLIPRFLLDHLLFLLPPRQRAINTFCGGSLIRRQLETGWLLISSYLFLDVICLTPTGPFCFLTCIPERRTV